MITKYLFTVKHAKSCIKTPVFKLELLVGYMYNWKLLEACLFDLFFDKILQGAELRPVVAEFDQMNVFFKKKCARVYIIILHKWLFVSNQFLIIIYAF